MSTVFNIKKQVNNFHAAPAKESKNSNATACLTPSQVDSLDTIAAHKVMSRSKLLGECVEFYLSHFDHLEKLNRYHGTVASLLKDLP